MFLQELGCPASYPTPLLSWLQLRKQVEASLLCSCLPTWVRSKETLLPSFAPRNSALKLHKHNHWETKIIFRCESFQTTYMFWLVLPRKANGGETPSQTVHSPAVLFSKPFVFHHCTFICGFWIAGVFYYWIQDYWCFLGSGLLDISGFWVLDYWRFLVSFLGW